MVLKWRELLLPVIRGIHQTNYTNLSPVSVKRQRKALALIGSRSSAKTVDQAGAEQLVTHRSRNIQHYTTVRM